MMNNIDITLWPTIEHVAAVGDEHLALADIHVLHLNIPKIPIQISQHGWRLDT